MAQFEPKKLNIGEINGGNRFNNGDGVSAEAINAPIEAVLYAEEIAQEAIGVKEQVQDHEERIAQNEYDTKMLYAIASQKGLYAVAEVEQAYTSRVTADGQNIVDGQKTPVTMIKGSTVRSENLTPFPYKGDVKNVGDTFVKNGLTYKVNADGSITVNGTATARADCSLFPRSDFTLPLGTYTVSGVPQGFSYEMGELQFVFGYSDGSADTPTFLSDKKMTSNIEITKEVNKIYVNIVARAGATFNNMTLKPMLNAGSTALPYQPYFTDLKHAKIDSIVSTGRNLFDKSKAKDGYEITNTTVDSVNADWFVTDLIPVLPNTTYVVSGKASGTAVICYDLNKNPHGNLGGGANGKLTTTANTYFVKLNGLLTQKDTFQLEVGTTATEYTPFIQETYQLPETLELPEWDRFNPQTGEIVRGTGYATSETGFTEEEIATYDSAIVSLDGKTLEYKLATPTIEEFNAPKSYPVYNQGNETAVLENEEFGAIPTITNEYIVVL